MATILVFFCLLANKPLLPRLQENLLLNSEAREWRHNSDKTQTNNLEWWMILKISLRAKASVPKTLVKQKLRLHSLYFPQNTLMLTESRGEFSDLHSIFRLRALRYFEFKNETTRTNLQVNKRTLKWRPFWPFWNKVYTYREIIWKTDHFACMVL